MKHLYKEWLGAPSTGEGSLSELQKTYLTRNGFLIRAVIYFAVWLLWSSYSIAGRKNRM